MGVSSEGGGREGCCRTRNMHYWITLQESWELKLPTDDDVKSGGREG